MKGHRWRRQRTKSVRVDMRRATAWRLALAVRGAVLAALVASVHLQGDTAGALGAGEKLARWRRRARGEGSATTEASLDGECAKRAQPGTAGACMGDWWLELAQNRTVAGQQQAGAGAMSSTEVRSVHAPVAEGLSGWALAPHGKAWEKVGEADSIRVLVCMPTMRRGNGVSFVERTLSAVRGLEPLRRQGAELREHVLVLHDKDYRPPGADFYLQRKPHTILAPCAFMRWRRALVLDFYHMMQAAMEIMESGGDGAGAGEYILWLEDDALLHQGWKETLRAKLEPELARGESPAWCVTWHQGDPLPSPP